MRLPPSRKRRSPAAARGEILDAAEQLLRDRSFRDLKIEDVMAATSLSKSSFWVYFEDRHALIRGLGDGIADQLYAAAGLWLHAPDAMSVEHARAGVIGLVSLYLEFGHVLTAFADAAGENEKIAFENDRVINRFARGTAAHIRREQSAGRIGPMNAKQVARAIVLLIHAYLSDAIRQKKRPSASTLIDTISLIETRTLYQISA